MMLPSLTAAEPTRIKFGLGIEFAGVSEGDWYKASLPRIATSDKGKAPLVDDEIKGHPAREMFSLICADIDFLVQLRNKKPMIFGYAYPSQFFLSNGYYQLNRNSMILLPQSLISSSCFTNSGLIDIVAVGTMVDVAVDPADFVGIFHRGLDVQLVPSDSSSNSSQPDPISLADSVSQRHMDTDLISPNPSTSTDSRIFFTTDDTTLDVDQILMAPDVTPLDFTEPLAQLRASVNQIQTERVQKRDDAEKLKDVLLFHINSLEQRFTEILNQQDRTYRGLFSNVRKEVQLQKAALSLDILASQQKLQSQQENYNHLTSQLSELVDYINRVRDEKKGKSGSSCGPQPPDERGRPGSGDGGGSRSELPMKRGGGSQRRDWRYCIGMN
ncbi:hypothetical protein F511_36421 [Dorcoceras hygrometricum]|uniref:Uncharacterized protein n=1 Tax=Dorcoceras hygrometricum TaxID=472368 RepID=A0A2Z7C4Q4_9LAMI|nr:hypothetical protein F511_36421 [Dorcoceras hygrometricum]